MRPEGDRFALESRWGARFVGESPFDPAYFRASSAFSKELPDMPIALYTKGSKIVPDSATEVGATLVAPYYNRHWDGTHAFYYCPPDRESGDPLLTIRNRVAYLTHPLFTAYHPQIASLELRQLIGNVIDRLLPKPLLRVSDAPSFMKALATTRPGQTIIHLLAYVPELRGRVQIVEDGIEVPAAKLSVRVDSPPPRRVFSAPDRHSVPFVTQDGRMEIVVPPFKGYTMLVLETSEA